MRRTTLFFVMISFVFSSIMPPQGFAQTLTAMGLMPQPGVAVGLTPAFTPAHLKGMVIHPKDPFKFDFLINRGDEPLTQGQKQQEYARLIKYFLAALAVPDADQWVNLSPYEKDRIIPDGFGLTEMGRDLLAQDYLLKQIAASLTNPDTGLGKKFWSGVYATAYRKFGVTDIPTDVFNKVWIMPDKAVVYEKGNTVVVLEHHLKVMLDSDYKAMKANAADAGLVKDSAAAAISKQVMREVIVPAIEKEVNEGKNFAPVRQVYSGSLLAAWYKRALKESILGKLYADQGKVRGIDQDPATNQDIYGQYVQAFKKGIFNMIKEDVDQYTKEVIPRKYFSGGLGMTGNALDAGQLVLEKDTSVSAAQKAATALDAGQATDLVTAGIVPNKDKSQDSGQEADRVTAEKVPFKDNARIEALRREAQDSLLAAAFAFLFPEWEIFRKQNSWLIVSNTENEAWVAHKRFKASPLSSSFYFSVIGKGLYIKIQDGKEPEIFEELFQLIDVQITQNRAWDSNAGKAKLIRALFGKALLLMVEKDSLIMQKSEKKDEFIFNDFNDEPVWLKQWLKSQFGHDVTVGTSHAKAVVSLSDENIQNILRPPENSGIIFRRLMDYIHAVAEQNEQKVVSGQDKPKVTVENVPSKSNSEQVKVLQSELIEGFVPMKLALAFPEGSVAREKSRWRILFTSVQNRELVKKKFRESSLFDFFEIADGSSKDSLNLYFAIKKGMEAKFLKRFIDEREVNVKTWGTASGKIALIRNLFTSLLAWMVEDKKVYDDQSNRNDKFIFIEGITEESHILQAWLDNQFGSEAMLKKVSSGVEVRLSEDKIEHILQNNGGRGGVTLRRLVDYIFAVAEQNKQVEQTKQPGQGEQDSLLPVFLHQGLLGFFGSGKESVIDLQAGWPLLAQGLEQMLEKVAANEGIRVTFDQKEITINAVNQFLKDFKTKIDQQRGFTGAGQVSEKVYTRILFKSLNLFVKDVLSVIIKGWVDMTVENVAVGLQSPETHELILSLTFSGSSVDVRQGSDIMKAILSAMIDFLWGDGVTGVSTQYTALLNDTKGRLDVHFQVQSNQGHIASPLLDYTAVGLEGVLADVFENYDPIEYMLERIKTMSLSDGRKRLKEVMGGSFFEEMGNMTDTYRMLLEASFLGTNKRSFVETRVSRFRVFFEYVVPVLLVRKIKAEASFSTMDFKEWMKDVLWERFVLEFKIFMKELGGVSKAPIELHLNKVENQGRIAIALPGQWDEVRLKKFVTAWGAFWGGTSKEDVTLDQNKNYMNVLVTYERGKKIPDVDKTESIQGGIDFAQSSLNMQIKRDGKGMPLPAGRQDFDRIHIDGLVPVILNIRPATGALILSQIEMPASSV